MSQIRKILGVGLLFGVAVHFLGCGPARAVPESLGVQENAQGAVRREEETSEEPQGLAERFGLKMVYGHTNPGREECRELNDSARITRNQIAFFRAFYLPERNAVNPVYRRELFFVWPEDSLGVAISHVWLRHGERRSVPARYDDVQHRWFISILDLFDDGPSRIFLHEAETQLVRIEMLMADQSRVVIEVRFRVRGVQR